MRDFPPLLGMCFAGCASVQPDPAVVVTFNTGTTAAAVSGAGSYGSTEAALSDAWYGDGLAWPEAIEQAATWFEQTEPDVVGLQEIFYTGDCGNIPDEARTGFVCEDWMPGDPTVAELVLGTHYTVACHVDHPDNCLAVHTSFGSIEGCSSGTVCLDALEGTPVDGCGHGARVGRGTVVRPDGTPWTIVNIHGTSGATVEDQACRIAQFGQIFVDLGDGDPGAKGDQALVVGDFNTDPVRMASFDQSAAFLADAVVEPFRWISEVGADAPGAYLGFDIDHVVANFGSGRCEVPALETGAGSGAATLSYFDHHPVLCSFDAER